MKIEYRDGGAEIVSEGERFYTESALFHAIKKRMQADGLDVIKKRPDKDGHMLSDPYYLRDRKWKFAYTDPLSAVCDLAKSFREGGHVWLQKHDWSEVSK